MKKSAVLILFVFSWIAYAHGQNVWNADLGNGMYKNPVLHTDYSDPDACRVGEDYYLVASSFNFVPGLPILHSKDLVTWRLIGHALQKLVPEDNFSKPQPGCGVWAPAIRYHKNEFYIYYPDPDFGIYVLKSKKIEGPWSEPVLVEGGKGLIDPCPLWDDDGKVYLVHAYANSRAGIKSILVVKEMNADGTKTVSESVKVFDGHETDPTIEGPKFYKRNGYYYIFAPAGGVKTGWQTILRSKSVYGPYERKIVLDQGNTDVNGPHQGAWVDTKSGEDWFLHFQDKGAYGRVVHLQPMKWVNDWPVIGTDIDGDGKGEPVFSFKKPNVGIKENFTQLPDNDEFKNGLGLQWQWSANVDSSWFKIDKAKGMVRLNAVPMDIPVYSDMPNLLTQKFPAEEFTVTTKIKISRTQSSYEAGLIVTGKTCYALSLKLNADGAFIWAPGYEVRKLNSNQNTVYLRTLIRKGAIINFKYSLDGITYFDTGHTFPAEPGRWVGARVGIYCSGVRTDPKSTYADFDWFRIEPASK